eukprot:gene16512-11809_t
MEWKGVTSLLAMASLSQGSRESLSARAALESLVGVPLGDRRRAASDAHMADWYHSLLAHTALYRDPALSPGLDSESYRTTNSRESPVTRDEASFVPRLAMVLDGAIMRIVVSLRATPTLTSSTSTPTPTSSLVAGDGGGGLTETGARPAAKEEEEAVVEEEPFVIEFDDGTGDSAATTAMARTTMPPPEAVSSEVEAAVLRALHRRLQRLPQWWEDHHRVKDYIQQPKASGYQSLHTSMVQVETGHRVELQIRSARMHWEAEHGRASHNVYKVLGLPSTQLLLAPERGHRSRLLSHRDRSQ